jgi:membrane protease YdiL (CAAX protease family)
VGEPAAPRALAAALVFAMTFPTVMAWLYFVAMVQETGMPSHPQQLAYGLGKAVQFALPILCLWWFDRRVPAWSPPRFRGLPLALAFGLVVGAAVLLLYFGWLRGSAVLAATPEKVQQKLQQFDAATPGRYLALAGFIAGVHSLLEEYYWRWFVFGWLRRLVPVGVALVLSSLAFMGHHVIVLAVYLPGEFWTAVVPFSLCVAGGGGMWAWLYHRTGTIYANWLSHLIVDAAILVVGYDLVFNR